MGYGQGKEKTKAFQFSSYLRGQKMLFLLFSFVNNIYFYDYNQCNKT